MIEPKYDFWSFIFLCLVLFILGIGYYVSYQGLMDYLGYTIFIHNKGPHLYRWMFMLFFSTNILLIVIIYFNELVLIDVKNKQITFKKIFAEKKTFSFDDIDGYVVERLRGSGGKNLYYFIKDDYVICRFNDVATTNWEEIKNGFEEIGYKKLSYKGLISLNCILGIKIKVE